MAETSVQRRAVLYFSDYTFDIRDVNEDMTQSSAVNPVGADADFAIGAACMSELKFSLNNLYQVISENSLAGKEFLLQRGKLTNETSVLDVYKKVNNPLFVQHSGFIFAANTRAPYLSIYSAEFVLQDAPEQPTQPVKSLFIVDGKLYCVHDKEPTITTYSISGGVLTLLPQSTLTPFYQRKMTEEYAKYRRCFTKQGKTVTEYISTYTDMKISEVIAETWQYSNFGYYIVTDPEKINDTKISVLAYDRMQKFEVVADAFLDSVTYPIPLKSLLTKLCAFVGVTFNNKTLINENYSVPRNFKTSGVTCRQVLQWIAQITASFAYMDADGKLTLSWYANQDSLITSKDSTVIDIADYVVKPIDKVQARAFETDIGVIYPDDKPKTNAYIIENNPLLYATADAQIRPAITNIYNAIKTFSYIPFTAKTYVVDENIKAGMVIPAKTIKGKNFPAYIMQSTIKGVRGLTAEYVSTGNEHRKIQTDAVNQAIMMLNGRTNSIIATIDEFSVTLDEVKDTGEQNTAQLLIQANQISTEVKRATAAEGQLSSKITQTAESVTTEVTRATAAEGQLSAQILTQADQISLKVSQTDYNGNTISSLINQTATSIKIQASKINLIGYATFSNLSDGTTIISGNNIKTGTVSANRLESNVLTTNNIETKNLTLTGFFKNAGSSSTIRMEDGKLIFNSSGFTGERCNIWYSQSNGTMNIDAGYTSSISTSLNLSSYYDIYMRTKSGNIFISPSSGKSVYIGSSTSNLDDIHADRYYQGSYGGYTGEVSYMKSATSSGRITVKGGIITSVT